MMKKNRRIAALTLVVAALVSACDWSPAEPEFLLEQPVVEALDDETALAVDPALAESALQSAEARVQPVSSANVRARLAAARGHFAEARRRYQEGRAQEARREGRRAREAIADALVTGLGPNALDGMIEEVEATIATLSVDGSGVDQPAQLIATLNRLVEGAKTDRARGRDREAAEKVVRGRQHTDRHIHRKHDGPRDGHGPDHRFGRDEWARVRVAMGQESLELASRLIGSAPSDLQELLLASASELQRAAEAALAAGELARAVGLSKEAEVTALRAVVGRDGVGHVDIQSIQAAASQLLEEARVAVAAGASAIDVALLELAARFYEKGVAQVAEGKIRGLALIWHSANVSGVILP